MRCDPSDYQIHGGIGQGEIYSQTDGGSKIINPAFDSSIEGYIDESLPQDVASPGKTDVASRN